ncbi:MAG: hypothetical protein ACK42A_10515 [Pyrinomonadaceae bacterium]|jgi:hypothetical protein
MKTTRFVLPVLVLTIAVFAAACPKRVTIAEIEANPARYYDKDVIVTGTVRDSYGLSVPGTPIKGGAYKIDDGTGSLWILTDDVVPGKGTEVGVKGRIGSGVSWKGRNYGLGMFEKERKFRKR